ncbi:MAG: 16S rRNA (uracil(1498)-N(3))-methyltransferase [Deltaproteobacteria bacterium]|nr:MAG: 16S rRNA (uracil(1498)-N(3))-methyltransferase [Deltaproteobacteria bacterium]
MLDPAESHHLLRVTGIAPGEAVVLFDGRGRQARAELVGTRSGRAVLRQLDEVELVRLPPLVLLVGVGKHPAMDTIVRMATELGATTIQPVLVERSVARGDRGPRWRRIAAGAAAQCGRADVPDVRPVVGLTRALADLPADLERRVYTPSAHRQAPPSTPCALLLGPEGGLSPGELSEATAAGFVADSLGPTVLRADTAVAAALARVCRDAGGATRRATQS